MITAYVAMETGLETRVKICSSYEEAKQILNSWIGEYVMAMIEDDDLESYIEFRDKMTITTGDEGITIIDNSIGEFYQIVKTEFKAENFGLK